MISYFDNESYSNTLLFQLHSIQYTLNFELTTLATELDFWMTSNKLQTLSFSPQNATQTLKLFNNLECILNLLLIMLEENFNYLNNAPDLKTSCDKSLDYLKNLTTIFSSLLCSTLHICGVSYFTICSINRNFKKLYNYINLCVQLIERSIDSKTLIVIELRETQKKLKDEKKLEDELNLLSIEETEECMPYLYERRKKYIAIIWGLRYALMCILRQEAQELGLIVSLEDLNKKIDELTV